MKTDNEQFNDFANRPGGYEALFNRHYPGAYAAFENLLTQVVKPGHEPMRVLDIGCGDGWTAHQVATQRYVEYFGIDPSKESIRQAQKRSPAEAVFKVAGADWIFESKGSYHLIICNAALHQIQKHTADMNGIIKRMCELCLPGCSVLIGDYFYPTGLNAKEEQAIRDWVLAKTGQHPTPPDGFMDPEIIAGICMEHGLSVVTSETVRANPEIALMYQGTLWRK